MKPQEILDYDRVAKAIHFIDQHFQEQPALEEIAAHVNLSPFHFQKLFTDWAGTSPKQFLQYSSIAYAKRLITEQQVTIFDASFETGFSASSRLHDLFVKIEGMTPGEYKKGGAGLQISYSFANTVFGQVLVAATSRGVCWLSFAASKIEALKDLQSHFYNSLLLEEKDDLQRAALTIFNLNWQKPAEIKLHLKATAFQLKVWEMLLKIPFGALSTYGKLATQMENPSASRAVGTAIGDNPVAFIIPCHRVIQSSGAISGYRWGVSRKKLMIGWEACKVAPAIHQL